MNIRRRLALPIVLVLLIVVIGGFAFFQYVIKPQMIEGFIAARTAPPITVQTEEAKQETWVPRLPAIGTLVAVQGIDVAPEVSGVVAKISFKSGQDVAAGAPLVSLDDSVEQADLKSGEAQLKNAELDLERKGALVKRKALSQAEYDSALAQRDMSAASVERTKSLIAYKAIVAPFAGRLGIRQVDQGQYVSAGTSLVSLQQLDPIYVDFPVPEENFDLLQVGQTVNVLIDAYPEQTFSGKVQSIDARVDRDTRNVLVRAVLANPDGQLLPGMFANVDVEAGAPQQVVTVPRTAITYSLYGDSVYVVENGSTGQAQDQSAAGGDAQPANGLVAKRKFVRVGEARGDRVALTQGVAAGDQVVASGQIKLRPDAPVTIDNSAPLQAAAERPKE